MWPWIQPFSFSRVDSTQQCYNPKLYPDEYFWWYFFFLGGGAIVKIMLCICCKCWKIWAYICSVYDWIIPALFYSSTRKKIISRDTRVFRVWLLWGICNDQSYSYGQAAAAAAAAIKAIAAAGWVDPIHLSIKSCTALRAAWTELSWVHVVKSW